ncbi:C6 transcription factor, putative [Penicillium digitatum]|uniref:C6 transcription factor, putative n=1 Tax=Penicillium digitatum TaxID=36651 RepID=A0A7T6XM69_PENDI|nr:C6 transcription factor, putative [Penicillium digitatum]
MRGHQRRLVPGPSSTGNDPDPDPDYHEHDDNSSPPAEEGKSSGTWKKRVSTACLACKKSKRKCSGTSPCANCQTFKRVCIFDESLDQRRRVAAKRTADELSYHRDLLSDLFKLVREANESDALHLLTIIRQNAPADEIRAYINEALASLTSSTSTSAAHKQETVAKLEDMRRLVNVEGTGPTFRRKVMDIHYLCDSAPCEVPAAPWTRVTADADLVSHLISLYFAWDWPFTAVLDKEVFVRHMRRGVLGSEFCSPFLVNAVLSNACYFSEFSEAYVVPGDISSKGCDFLAEAEKLRGEENSQPSLAGLQGTLLMYERYALSREDDLGYIMLHQAIRMGEALGLVGSTGPQMASGKLSQDMDISCKRTAWGLFNVDTVVHTSFLRPSLIDHVNMARIDINQSEDQSLWQPYPTHRDPRPSFFSQYFDEACNLSTIARDISRSMFADHRSNIALGPIHHQSREDLYDRICRWHELLPEDFDVRYRPAPHIILLKMRYNALIINLFSCIPNDKVPLIPFEPQTPESPPRHTPETKSNAREVTQSAARDIAALTRLHRREFGVSRAHQFAMYAINLALFTMLEQDSFDVLDEDFLSLASAFSVIASRSALGRNLFHIFRQSVRAKAQGYRIREASSVPDELKDLFDEASKERGCSRFDEYADGLEKLNQKDKYHGIGEKKGKGKGKGLQDYPGLGLSDMLDRYESLSLGKDDVLVERDLQSLFFFFFFGDGLVQPFENQDDTTVDDYDWTPFNAASVPQQQFATPIPFSPILPPAQAFSPYVSAPSTSTGSTAPKVAIPRLANPDTLHGRRRSARACEPCRQRKIKCDGVRPLCGQCAYHHHSCSYEDVKRVRDQKRLGSLVKRVDKYEALLRELEAEVDPPTARRIKRALKTLTVIWQMKSKNGKTARNARNHVDSDNSSTSMGSLDAIDQVDEDLNRNEETRAAGFFGKNSEVNWIRKLESGVGMKSPQENWPTAFHTESHRDSAAMQKQQQALEKQIPTSMMDYHLDSLEIPLIEPCDPLAVPPRKLADRYFDAYLTNVHPTFSAIRKMTFISQYQTCFNNASTPPRKWLAILNMIFAIGCRYCRLIDNPQSTREEDLLYLTRARHLGLHGNVLFEHTDLQQIQLELLVAVYLLCIGQVNRASKFSNMALRSALSLGINLRLTDDRTKDAAKETRGRLWWSIYSLEHLITSMTGRASCVGEGLCSVPAPLPYDEETFDQPDAKRLLQDPVLREAQLRPTIFEAPRQHHSPAWVTICPPCPSLFFYFLFDLTLITHALMNKVYSIEGLRKGSSQVEYHVQKFSLQMDRWLSKLPLCYQFTLPNATSWHLHHLPRDDLAAPFVRERVCLAMNYYSARITLCRPCLSHIHQSLRHASPVGEPTARGTLRSEMATHCLQASCALISVLPEDPNMTWLARAAPWWSILHFLMQATTALLLGLSYCSGQNASTSPDGANPLLSHATAPSIPQGGYPPLLETGLGTAIAAAKKALFWLHTTASVDPAARRAFLLCDGIVRKIALGLGIDLSEWPDRSCFEGLREERSMRSSGNWNGSCGDGSGSNGLDSGSGMEAFEELVDFEGGVC